MLFNGERPRRAPDGREIVLEVDRLGQHPQQEAVGEVGVVGGADDRGGEHDVERRINLEAAPDQKSSDAERVILLILSEEQPGNEEPAQHKKQIDRNPADLMPNRGDRPDRRRRVGRRQLHVAPEDQNDRYAPQQVQLLHARQATTSTTQARRRPGAGVIARPRRAASR